MNENRRSAKHNKKSKLSCCFWCKQKNKKERKKTSKSGEKRSGGGGDGGKWQHRGDRFGCEKAKENPLAITPRVSKNFAASLSPLLGWIEFPPAQPLYSLFLSQKREERKETSNTNTYTTLNNTESTKRLD